jgi:FkbM family methyltransferase
VKIPQAVLSAALTAFHRLPPGAKLWLRSLKPQEPEFYELPWLVAPSTLAVDIGANKGAYTYRLGRLVGPRGLVVAVEPIHELAEYLQRACRQLRLPVHLHECGLSARDGTAQLFIPTAADGSMATGLATLDDRDAAGPGEAITIATQRLDRLLADRDKRVSFIKCDVEGHEIEVFRGGMTILGEDRPNLLVEIEQRHLKHDIRESFAFFRAAGYDGWFLDDGHLRGIAEFRAGEHQNTQRQPGPSGATYINNFLFLPEGVDAIRGRRRKAASRR